ncbi:MAG: hypothetical protein OQK35_04725 [Alphaproteobacteria bacterium]|nr:hypothetical protein [Alphaproteobacteria bacterium]
MKQPIGYRMDRYGRILVRCAGGVERHATEEEGQLMAYTRPEMVTPAIAIDSQA